MTLVRGLVAVVVRVAALALLTAVGLALSSQVTTGDALGDGLLFFLGLTAIVLVWALVDAARRGFVSAAVLWVVVSLLASVALSVVFYVANDEPSLADEIRQDIAFFPFLLLVPAFVGLALGGLVHRSRRPAVTTP